MYAKSRPKPKTYDDLVAAYRTLDRVDHVAAARIAGTTPAIAKRAWISGWELDAPTSYPMPAIRDLHEREALAARAIRQKAHAKAMSEQSRLLMEASDDAAHQRAIEGMAVRSVMLITDKMAQGMLDIVTSVFPRLQKKLAQIIEEVTADDEIPLSRLQQIVTWLFENHERLGKLLEKAQAAERKYLGEADQTVKLIDNRTADERLGAIAETLVKLQTTGRLELRSLIPEVREMAAHADAVKTSILALTGPDGESSDADD